MPDKETWPYLQQINRMEVLIDRLYKSNQEKDRAISRYLQMISLLKLKASILEGENPFVDEIGEHEDQMSMVL